MPWYDDEWQSLQFRQFGGQRHPRVAAEQTAAEVAFIISSLRISPGARVLDAPCGTGRHALRLAAMGYSVLGLDLSSIAVSEAMAAARHQSVDIEVIQCDLRNMTFESTFDAVINLNTSFGFFNDVENQHVLQRLSCALVRGGRLLIDTVNLFRLARSLVVPARWEPIDDIGGIAIEDRSYDFATGRRLVEVTVIYADGRRVPLSHSIRIYTLPELTAMLSRAGMKVEGVWGGYDGSEYNFDSRRMIVAARRM
jgi:SAM-dependent methyltransferase